MSAQDDLHLKVGDVFYDYSTKLSSDVEPISDLRFMDYDIHCVEKTEIIESQIPKVDFQLTTGNKKWLLGVADNMILWKGIEGPDPYLGVDKYFQFKEGVPVYNLNEPSDFDRDGQLNIYFEYKIDELPDNVGVWATLMEYSKLKVKVQVDYNTAYLGFHQQAFTEVIMHELLSEVSFSVINYQAKMLDEWVDVVPDAHPSLKDIFAPITMSEKRLADVHNPLGSVIYRSSPETEVVFRSMTSLQNLPECDDSDNQIYVYPNPSFGDITIRMDNNGYGPYTFELFNVVGHPVRKETLSGASIIHVTYDLGYLEKGIYLYSIKDSRGAYLQTKRLIIVKR